MIEQLSIWTNSLERETVYNVECIYIHVCLDTFLPMFRTSRRRTLTRCGRTLVIIDVYFSTIGGNPTSKCALAWPALFIMVWDFLHHGTKCLYSSTFATTSYISIMEYLMGKTNDTQLRLTPTTYSWTNNNKMLKWLNRVNNTVVVIKTK